MTKRIASTAVFSAVLAGVVGPTLLAQAGGQAQAPQVQPAPQVQIVEQVLVKVNGDIITKTELEERQIAALRERKLNPDVLNNEEQLKQALAEVTPQILVSAIDELLLLQRGRERGFKLTDEQFNRWLTDMRKDQGLEDEARFLAALKQEGMTLADVRRNVERRALIMDVQRAEFGGKLQITEEEARQYYLAHQHEFAEPSTVTLREILIEVPVVTSQGRTTIAPGQDEQAKAKADAARARLTAGEDFAKLAAEVSTSASKANGGLIGPIAVGELSSDLQKVIEKLKPGDLTEVIRTSRGYQILKLDTFKAAGQRTFDSVRDIVADRVYQERLQSETRKFLDRVRSQAIIVWKNEELRKAYERQVGAKAAGNPG